jgi:ABC-type phosphate transport system permease subunit
MCIDQLGKITAKLNMLCFGRSFGLVSFVWGSLHTAGIGVLVILQFGVLASYFLTCLLTCAEIEFGTRSRRAKV